jgi:hypothetical protein
MQNVTDRPICHRAEDLVTFLYGEASEVDAADFTEHLTACVACQSEYRAFQQVHDSIVEWRTAALGSVPVAAPAVTTAPVAVPRLVAANPRTRVSAIAALREFFGVAPFWLRSASAVAAVAVIALVMILGVRMRQGKVYTQAQLDEAVNRAVNKVKVTQPTPTQVNSPDKNQQEEIARDNPKPAPAQRVVRATLVVNRQRPVRLNRQEREQLAADLRLIPNRDEEESRFLLSDEPEE